MADVFLVTCLYALMLGMGPSAAWLLGRRARAEGALRRARLRASLAQDPCVLLEHAQSAQPLVLSTVERGVSLRIRAEVTPGAPPCWRAQLRACEEGALPGFYLGVTPRGPGQAGWAMPRISHVLPGLRAPGLRLEMRSSAEDVWARLWCVPEVREALLHCFCAPAPGVWVCLEGSGELEIAVRLSFHIERVRALRARAAALGLALARCAAAPSSPHPGLLHPWRL